MPKRGTLEEWKPLVAAHREKQLRAIPREWLLTPEQLQQLSGHGTPDAGRLIKLEAVKRSGILTDRELEITEKYTARELLNKMAEGSLTSEEVTVAFCKRAALAQQLVCHVSRRKEAAKDTAQF